MSKDLHYMNVNDDSDMTPDSEQDVYRNSYYENRKNVKKSAKRVIDHGNRFNSNKTEDRDIRSVSDHGQQQRPSMYYRRDPIWHRNLKENRRDRLHYKNYSERNGDSKEVIFYILLFILVAVLFKYVILKNIGMTAVAVFIIILTVVGHLRDK